jgi:hypothetical protein
MTALIVVFGESCQDDHHRLSRSRVAVDRALVLFFVRIFGPIVSAVEVRFAAS